MGTPEEKPTKKKPVLFSKEHLNKHPHARWLNSAIRSNRWGKEKKITITYKKQNDETVKREVRPIHAKGDLLLAHDYHRNAIRSFKIGRIDNMEKTAFQLGFEKGASINIKDDEVWKTKWHPEGERHTVHKAIFNKLTKNKHRLTTEGIEELESHSGFGGDSELMWHPRFLKKT